LVLFVFEKIDTFKYTWSTKYIMSIKSTESTTIRISKETKEKIENLDFVRKDTFDQILNKLISFYEKNKKVTKNEK
jgi:hypothetical protein